MIAPASRPLALPNRAVPGVRMVATPVVLAVSLLFSGFVYAQDPGFVIVGESVKKQANAVLALMGYTLVPDVTTGSLSIRSGTADDPGLRMAVFGGGFNPSSESPLYLEGTAGYMRYDPTFVATNGEEERFLPLKWNSFTVTGGVGWDFPVAEDWVFRPIFNFTLGHVESDLSLAGLVLEGVTGLPLDFFEDGRLTAYGLGGTVMFDYESYKPERDIDVELRATSMHLRSFGGTSDAVEGSANTPMTGLYARYRAPTGMTALNRPVRYVLEGAHSHFFGSHAGVLGFNSLTSLGLGLELDTSAYDVVVSRARVVARYVFGNNVSGVSLGFAVSF